jgi:hypothetical protein
MMPAILMDMDQLWGYTGATETTKCMDGKEVYPQRRDTDAKWALG